MTDRIKSDPHLPRVTVHAGHTTVGDVDIPLSEVFRIATAHGYVKPAPPAPVPESDCQRMLRYALALPVTVQWWFPGSLSMNDGAGVYKFCYKQTVNPDRNVTETYMLPTFRRELVGAMAECVAMNDGWWVYRSRKDGWIAIGPTEGFRTRLDGGIYIDYPDALADAVARIEAGTVEP